MLTIRSLVDVASLELRVLVPGPEGALDSPLRWLHNTELLDPSAYLRDGELVLTNGLWHDGGNAETFVSNVVSVSGAGVVFGLRSVTPATPSDLIEACERARLPLLELAVEIPFTEVTRQAAVQLAGQRQRVLVDAVRRGNDLASAISRGAGATGVLRVLRREHNLPLAVVDRMGRVLAVTGTTLSPDDARQVAEALRLRPPPLQLRLASAGPAVLFLVNSLGGADAALVCVRPLSELSEQEGDALGQAAHYLSLEVARTELMRAIEARFTHELLEMILSGNRADSEVAARLETFGIRADGPLAVLAAMVRGDGPSGNVAAEAAVREFFAAEGVPAVAISSSQDVVVIFPWHEPMEALTMLADRLIRHVGTDGAGDDMVAGLGGVAEGSRRLRLPLRQARDACRALRRNPRRPRVAHFEELGSHLILLGALDEATRKQFADTVLGPLRSYDVRRGTRLETTARAFLGNDGQWAATAASLYIHVNTLRNRLAKIAELTGHDMTTTEGRVDVFLALEADDAVSPR